MSSRGQSGKVGKVNLTEAMELKFVPTMRTNYTTVHRLVYCRNHPTCVTRILVSCQHFPSSTPNFRGMERITREAERILPVTIRVVKATVKVTTNAKTRIILVKAAVAGRTRIPVQMPRLPTGVHLLA